MNSKPWSRKRASVSPTARQARTDLAKTLSEVMEKNTADHNSMEIQTVGILGWMIIQHGQALAGTLDKDQDIGVSIVSYERPEGVRYAHIVPRVGFQVLRHAKVILDPVEANVFIVRNEPASESSDPILAERIREVTYSVKGSYEAYQHLLGQPESFGFSYHSIHPS